MSTSPTPIYNPLTANKLAALIAKNKAQRLANEKAGLIDNTTASGASLPAANTDSQTTSITQGVGRTGELITYNERQLEFINTVTNLDFHTKKPKSCVLIGAAGTGKTTCQRGAVEKLVQSGYAGVLEPEGHKYLPPHGAPGIVIVAYTRRAIANIRKYVSDDMKGNCITIHKLLEYEPVYFSITDPVSGKEVNTMRFEATRHKMRPLPQSIHTVIIEESSMVSVELFNEIKSATPHNPQFIFLGDIQQLPPVFGSAILGYKMLELPVVELTEVYRQALESPIIRLAHRILSGKGIEAKEFSEWKYPNQLTLHPWKKKLHPDIALLTAAKFFTGAIEQKLYDPEQDMILIPFNKSFGTDELNNHIANYLARQQNKVVWEIIAGFKKMYLSVGDKVLYDKEDAIVVKIEENDAYGGKMPQKESTTLDYWGHDTIAHARTEKEFTDENMEFLMSQAAGEDDDRVRASSHTVTLRKVETDHEIIVDTASGINALIMGYALTVHKAQGSEFRRVFLVLHQSHATMLCRELLYTAVTRAKEELYCIVEPESFVNGIKSQRIKGNTLKEKSEYFKGKLDSKLLNKP